MATELLFHSFPELYQADITVMDSGKDENGVFIIPDRTIYYFGGGGQPPDKAWLTDDEGNTLHLTAGKAWENGIAHYLSGADLAPGKGSRFSMEIDGPTRATHSRIHTAGHLVGSVIHEFLKWPLIPVKGYHYPDSPYVEFDNGGIVNDYNTNEADAAMAELIRGNLPVNTSTDGSMDHNPSKTFIPPGFHLAPGKNLRWVGIGNFLFYPCGGTHVSALGSLGEVKIKYAKSKKGNLRIAYQMENH